MTFSAQRLSLYDNFGTLFTGIVVTFPLWSHYEGPFADWVTVISLSSADHKQHNVPSHQNKCNARLRYCASAGEARMHLGVRVAVALINCLFCRNNARQYMSIKRSRANTRLLLSVKCKQTISCLVLCIFLENKSGFEENVQRSLPNNIMLIILPMSDHQGASKASFKSGHNLWHTPSAPADGAPAVAI